MGGLCEKGRKIRSDAYCNISQRSYSTWYSAHSKMRKHSGKIYVWMSTVLYFSALLHMRRLLKILLFKNTRDSIIQV